MALISRLQTVDEQSKARAIRKLVEDSTPDFDFFLMITLSVLMATLGLIAGSETIVIGSMLIAPLLHPVLGLALGVSMSDYKLIRRSLHTVGKALLFAIGAAIVATLLFSFSGASAGDFNETIFSRAAPSLIFLAIAVVSGLAVAYALVRPGLSETLPGVAVSVALIPPLGVIGIGIATFNVSLVAGATLMFLVNVVGIVGAAMFAFSAMDVREKRHVAESTMKKEETRVEQEEAEVEDVEKKAEAEATTT